MSNAVDPALLDALGGVDKPNGIMPDDTFFDAGSPPKAGPWTWVGGEEIFFGVARPARWVVKDLGIAPGRPTLLSGASGGAKTIIAQSLVVSLATGRPIWGRFMRGADVQPVKCAHVDVDLGLDDVIFRYRRLHAGFPGGELHPALLRENIKLVSFPSPRIDLRQESARERLRKELHGVEFCVMDALRGLASGNENDSEFRFAVDTLTAVSGDIGVTFFLLHHLGLTKFVNGKPVEDDDDSAGRGTSGIRDGAGAAFKITGTRERGRKLRMVKPPGRMGVDWGGRKFSVAVDDVADAPLVDNEALPLRVTVSPEHTKSREEIADEAAKTSASRDAQVTEACIAIVRQQGAEGFRGGVDKLVRTVRDALKGHRVGLRNDDGRSLVHELLADSKLFTSGKGPATRITLSPVNESLPLEPS